MLSGLAVFAIPAGVLLFFVVRGLWLTLFAIRSRSRRTGEPRGTDAGLF